MEARLTPRNTLLPHPGDGGEADPVETRSYSTLGTEVRMTP